ncbi:MAG: xanthine dehydrogenase family protein molybdopterin-binding subunit, partial [Gemmatimonadaceae bacterium]
MSARPPLFGQSIKRTEDPRLLRGEALFVDDLNPPDLLHVAIVRSVHAHAALLHVDVGAARAHPGVHAVYTADDLRSLMTPGPLLVPPPPIPGLTFNTRTQTPLARGKVRHVGEAIAVIVADSRYVAEDAAELVLVDVDSLDAVVELDTALAPNAPLVHDDLPSNLAAHVAQR